ncbi:hypothetical protein MPSEU_000573000 [Mayamaea pseudoterrestris]|nr:hypothetical protein MPSEU_000573000 [Mayamaea pseudoterrestris]
MDDMTSIPIMSKPANLMEAGPNGNNLAAAAQGAHPVDGLQQRVSKASSHLDHVRHVYGSGLAMILATEQRIALQQDRMAHGLPSSHVYRDVVTGTDVQLDFCDFLTLPEYQPDAPKENPHVVMERQLRMM